MCRSRPFPSTALIARGKSTKQTRRHAVSGVKSADSDVRNGIRRDDAEAAVRILIQWAGDDAAREGVLNTPARVVRS